MARPARAALKLPNPDTANEMRSHQLKVIQMHAVVREIIIYIVFALVVMFLGYANVDKHSFLMQNHVADLLDSGNNIFTFSSVRICSMYVC